MARVKGGFTARRRHNKVLKLTKGQFGARHKHIRKAKEASLHALAYATHDRRLERREIRKLWILRINAAARLNGTTYSKLISALKDKGVELNRKSLAELAARDADAFAALVKEAQTA